MTRVLIAGAGLGGLTAALALLKSGFDVEVYEQARALGEVGAGVQLSANGTRVLYGYGLGPALESVGWPPQGKEIRLWNTGQAWPMFDLGERSVELYGFPYLTFHRADLHSVLVDAVRAIKPDAIHVAARAVGVEQDEHGATLLLEDGRRMTGDVVVGSDGVHSEIRQALFGADQPSFTGCVAWRGVIEAAGLPDGLIQPKGTIWIGPGGHIVHYHLRRGELVNFVGVVERDDWLVESWTAEGTVAECLRDFEGWHETARELIRHLTTPYKWALKTRAPMERWSRGRVTLLGDACHSTLPFLAQGANQALEDGCILARCLKAAGDDVAGALIRYERARLERTAKVVQGSTDNMERLHSGALAEPEGAARFADAQWDVESVRMRYDWLFTYDATRVPL
jgi:salicylate hydroxylase